MVPRTSKIGTSLCEQLQVRDCSDVMFDKDGPNKDILSKGIRINI